MARTLGGLELALRRAGYPAQMDRREPRVHVTTRIRKGLRVKYTLTQLPYQVGVFSTYPYQLAEDQLAEGLALIEATGLPGLIMGDGRPVYITELPRGDGFPEEAILTRIAETAPILGQLYDAWYTLAEASRI